MNLNASYPQQVSVDQSSHDKSEIAFSNGFSYASIDTESKSRKRNEGFVTEDDSFRRQLLDSRATGSNNVITNLSGRPKAPPRYKEHINHSERLRTYARWIHRRPDPTSLSIAGFFFTNQEDLVRCFQCGIGLKHFSSGDDPLKEHVRNSPSCPFLIEYLGKERLSAIKRKCQPPNEEINQPQNRETASEICRHPEYSSVGSRISSFVGWPKHVLQKPRDLAEAGLFYTGKEDQVRCFTCDGGLRRWDPEDDPWTEHCGWFPNCPFVRRMKGDAFIALIQTSAKYRNGDDLGSNNKKQIEKTTDISHEMEQMTLRDPGLQTALQEHIDNCLEMGFKLKDINAATEELLLHGKVNPTIEELLDTIYKREAQQMREKENEKKQNDSPLEENRRLKSFIMCTKCRINNTNALFLPCTHHRFCMDCAEPMKQCPVCEQSIRRKIRTYLS